MAAQLFIRNNAHNAYNPYNMFTPPRWGSMRLSQSSMHSSLSSTHTSPLCLLFDWPGDGLDGVRLYQDENSGAAHSKL